MRDAFEYVLFGVVIVGAVAAVFTAAMAGGAYKEIGKGGFFTDADALGPDGERRLHLVLPFRLEHVGHGGNVRRTHVPRCAVPGILWHLLLTD